MVGTSNILQSSSVPESWPLILWSQNLCFPKKTSLNSQVSRAEATSGPLGCLDRHGIAMRRSGNEKRDVPNLWENEASLMMFFMVE